MQRAQSVVGVIDSISEFHKGAAIFVTVFWFINIYIYMYICFVKSTDESSLRDSEERLRGLCCLRLIISAVTVTSMDITRLHTRLTRLSVPNDFDKKF